jgi:hypothetical protein
MVELWGAGGGGGGGGLVSGAVPAGYGGAAGAAGTYTRTVIDVTPGSTLTVTLGDGGPGGAPGVNGTAGGASLVLQSNVILVTAGGGGGGGAGSATSEGEAAQGGTRDQQAPISFNSTNVFALQPDYDGLLFGTPDVCSQGGAIRAGGRGLRPTGSIPGTIIPPANASTGGSGGDGQFVGAIGICPAPASAATSGSTGKRGYAVISW